MKNNMSQTPLGANLFKLAQEGNTPAIERIARNLAQERGIDYDKEFSAFVHRLGLK
jgi:transposase